MSNLPMGVEIRRGRPNDTGDYVTALYSAGPGIYDFIYRDRRRAAADYIGHEYRSTRGFCGCYNVTVAAIGREVIATGCVYDGSRLQRLLLGSGLNMLRFYGPIGVIQPLLRSRHMDSVMRSPARDELYLANFGVVPQHRGQGIGTLLLRHWLAPEHIQGFRRLILDVDDDNPGALRLYKRLGFSVLRHKAFSGNRPGTAVPGTYELELDLQSDAVQALRQSSSAVAQATPPTEAKLAPPT